MKKAFSVFAIVLLADQALKLWIKCHWALGHEVHVADWFILHFTENRGMAFGMELGGEYGKLALSLFRIGAVGLLFWFVLKQARLGAGTLTMVSLGLILAGAVGNILDSMFYGMMFSESYGRPAEFLPPDGGYAPFLYGRVVDMLHFPLIQGFFPDWLPIWGGEHFLFFRPVFNIADSAISVGISLILLFQRDLLTSLE